MIPNITNNTIEDNDETTDKFKTIRRFLYGRNAIKEGVNRELIVAAAYKGDIRWSYAPATLEQAVGYLKCQYQYDPLYESDRELFFNS